MIMFGLDEDEWRYLQNVFASTQALDRVVLYGSRAKGNYKPFSDIDITLIGQNLSESDLTDVMSKLDDSSMPYFCDVSLFKNITSKPLIDHIMRKGKTIYQRKAC